MCMIFCVVFVVFVIGVVYFVGMGVFVFSQIVVIGVVVLEFMGINQWLNLLLLFMKDLCGKVVLVDFWMYFCINCFNMLLYVKQWYDKYKDQGLVVVGVYILEYVFEKLIVNVQEVFKCLDVCYLVVQDNSYVMWLVFYNQFWFVLYLIDVDGCIVYQYFGEGCYVEMEVVIQKLLVN